MGMDASVICVGPFSLEVANCLQYPADHYAETQPGAPIVTELMVCNTTDTSHELARLLGVEPFDFNTHVIDKTKVKWDEFSEELVWSMDDDVEHLKMLLDHGFIAFYRPNY